MSNGCKVNNALIVYKDTKVGRRGAKVMVAHANSLACLRVKPCSNWHCEGGAIGVESKSNKVDDAPTTDDKFIACAYAYKRCSI